MARGRGAGKVISYTLPVEQARQYKPHRWYFVHKAEDKPAPPDHQDLDAIINRKKTTVPTTIKAKVTMALDEQGQPIRREVCYRLDGEQVKPVTSRKLRAIRYTQEEKRVFAEWYAMAKKLISRRVPARDREDILQEIAVKLIARNKQSPAMVYLVTKETLVQYYRRGRIENRNYRNLLMFRAYTQTVYSKKTGQPLRTVHVAKYVDGTEETILTLDDIAEEVGIDTTEVTIDKLFFDSLPKSIRDIAQKRAEGYPLTGAERTALYRFLKRNTDLLQYL